MRLKLMKRSVRKFLVDINPDVFGSRAVVVKLLDFCFFVIWKLFLYRGVAQLGSAHGSGP